MVLISFPSALALGIEALDEVIEMEVVGAVELQVFDQLIRREMPAGMELLKLESLQTSLGKAKVLGASYRIPHCLPDSQPLQQRIDEIMSSETLEILREDKTIVCNPRDPFFDLKIENEFFVFSIPSVAQGSVRPSELLSHVGLGQLLEDGQTLQRTAVHIHEPELVHPPN